MTAITASGGASMRIDDVVCSAMAIASSVQSALCSRPWCSRPGALGARAAAGSPRLYPRPSRSRQCPDPLPPAARRRADLPTVAVVVEVRDLVVSFGPVTAVDGFDLS